MNEAGQHSKIAIGCDHNGLEIKNLLRDHLIERGCEVVDFGVHDNEPVDYPEIAGSVAEAVQKGTFNRAVLVCGTGAGMAIAANKVPGVRAVCVHDPYTAERARASNDAQIMTLGSQIVGSSLAIQLIDIWLASEFQGGRSAPKVAKICELERKYWNVASVSGCTDRETKSALAATLQPERLLTPWLGTSWKMNKTRTEAREYAQLLIEAMEASPLPATVFILPPFTALDSVCEITRGAALKVGAQNMHWADDGPYTGEVSPLMIKESGAELVELGHFERRQEFGETDSSVNRKVRSALEHGLRPLICVGETDVQQAYSVAEEVVACQVKIALHDVGTDRIPDILIAYEPGWAIGEKGTEANPVHVNAMHLRIREVIGYQYGQSIAEKVHILYGGSVTSTNAAAFACQPEVDGLFVGRAAWEVGSFVDIIRTFCATRSELPASPLAGNLIGVA